MEDNEHEAQTTSRNEAKPANKAEHEKQEEVLTQENAEPEQHPSTPLPIIEPLPYSSESVLTGVPMTASMTPNHEQGSSSIEPRWGRIESSKEKERMEDLRLWESINIGGHMNQRTTKAYRHGRCYMCSKPVSTTNLDPEVELFCKGCDQMLVELNCRYRSREQTDTQTKRGMERTEKDDEEEWGRIPIPQSDDSDNEPWLDESSSPESEQEEEDVTIEPPFMRKQEGFSQNALMIVNNHVNVNKESTEDFPFRNGPRRDGSIRRKDGSILTMDDQPYSKDTQPEKALEEEERLPENEVALPRWSPLLLAIQHLNLRMGHRSKSKVKAKLMRFIRKQVPFKVPIRWEPMSSGSRHINLRLHSWTATNDPIYRPEIKETKEKTNSVTTAELKALASAPSHLTRWDITQGFTKQTYPTGNILVQCMNAIRSPNRKITKTKRVLKLPIHSRLAKRARPTLSPITIPGTPEKQLSTQRSEAVEDNQEEDLELYYKIYANFKPEMGESNAESVKRTDAIEAEYQLRKNLKKAGRKEEKRVNKNKHSLSPFQPIQPAPRFQSRRHPSPIVEPIDLHLTEVDQCENHVQQVTIDTDHGLYDNPDKPYRNEPIQVIYDTGASISMLPAKYASS